MTPEEAQCVMLYSKLHMYSHTAHIQTHVYMFKTHGHIYKYTNTFMTTPKVYMKVYLGQQFDCFEKDLDP